MLVLVPMMIIVFRPRVHGPRVQFRQTMLRIRLLSLVLLVRQGAIVGPIPTMTGILGMRAHHTVSMRVRGLSTIPVKMKPVAHHAQNFQNGCLKNRVADRTNGRRA